MEVVAYYIKQPTWFLDTEDKYSKKVATGNHDFASQHVKLDLPIFSAQIKYIGYSKSRSSVKADFEIRWSGEDATMRALMGETTDIVHLSLGSAMRILDLLMMGDFFEMDNGWATGLFTFRKAGTSVTILPFIDDINDTKKYRKVEQS